MRKSINLFALKERDKTIPVPLLKARKYGIIFLCVIIPLVGGIFAADYYFKQQIDMLSDQETQMLRYLADNKRLENKIAYFVYKKELLKRFLKDDAQFLSYYTVLDKLVATLPGPPVVETFLIDKTQSTEFVLTFPSYESAYGFINVMEKEPFLKNFQTIKLDTFSLSQLTQNTGVGRKFQLRLTGKFKIISTGSNDKSK